LVGKILEITFITYTIAIIHCDVQPDYQGCIYPYLAQSPRGHG